MPAAEAHALCFTKGLAPRALPKTWGIFPHAPLFDSDLRIKQKIGNRTDLFCGAGGRNRTDMELPPEDFESSASTNFTTPARPKSYTNPPVLSSEKAGTGPLLPKQAAYFRIDVPGLAGIMERRSGVSTRSCTHSV